MLDGRWYACKSRLKRISAHCEEDATLPPGVGLGPSKRAVVERMASRPNLAGVLFEAIRQHRPDLLRYLPDDPAVRIRSTRDEPTKPNLAAILTSLLFLWGSCAGTRSGPCSSF